MAKFDARTELDNNKIVVYFSRSNKNELGKVKLIQNNNANAA